MPLVVDFHTHVVPPKTSLKYSKLTPGIEKVRKKARDWMKPVASSLHQSQTWVRILPEPLRKPLDQIGMLAPLPGLLFESSPQDLSDAMQAAGVDYAVVIAHPPHLENDTLVEICERYPQFLPVANIPAGTERPGQVLRKYVDQGVRALKIHAAADGEGAESPRYRALLKVADELGLPVILHTGCLHSKLLYKNPEMGRVETFAPWFETYRDIRFVLAHMNLHEPAIALDLAEEHANLFVDTSWQPCEVLGEAVRRIGAQRVLFGTDWPLIGNNIDIGIRRIRECVDAGEITGADAELILGKNAQCLLNLPN